jgi:hypothetical protein
MNVSIKINTIRVIGLIIKNTYNYLPLMRDYNNKNRRAWTYAPERQLFEMLFEYCITKNLDINQTICEIMSDKQAYYLLSRHYHLINH